MGEEKGPRGAEVERERVARWERGREMLAKVYAGAVSAPARGASAFMDVMLEQLFAEVWSREEQLPMRDRRLLLLGVCAALGESAIFRVQAQAALARGELSAAELREVLLHLAPYAGYPRTAPLLAVVEECIAAQGAGGRSKPGGAGGAATGESGGGGGKPGGAGGESGGGGGKPGGAGGESGGGG
ncbi:MAG: carboxymuconolactone decarboxylase family protein [Deltaproteobacteria bacterium]|nr:carboxymuconolactone decarboxylase family protein [Deltaproteobacteria bacterium]